jgi:hypothetical protein
VTVANETVRINFVGDGFDLTGGIPPETHEHVSVRRFEHRRHVVEIETTYRISIDGVEFPDPIHVSDNGTVRYHGFPQYSTPSAVDLVKVIIDRASEGNPPPLVGEQQPDNHDGLDHGGHPHDGGH